MNDISDWLSRFFAGLAVLKNPATALPLPPPDAPLPALLAAWKAVAVASMNAAVGRLKLLST